MMRFKTYLDDALNNHRSKHFVTVQALLALFTVISIISIILETVPSLSVFSYLFAVIEIVSLAVFVSEYLARITVSKSKSKYIFSFWGILDLASFLPTLLGLGNLFFLKAGRALVVLRLLRMLRIAKISRAYLQSLQTDEKNISSEKNFSKITIGIYFLTLFSAITIFGTIFYALENNQETYSTIPLAMLQSAKILLGGLGSVEPHTLAGELVMIGARLVGLALLGLLISVIGESLKKLLFEHQIEK